ncbi:MAG: hypothetical protein NC200_00115 [Candidatus Gastranaerophilales bacterium]|nr:hypothetical protein [Candidatus Gastranaerophilales bacterium]
MCVIISPCAFAAESSYTKPDNYTYGSRIEDTLTNDISNVVFTNLSFGNEGGAIRNTQNANVNIIADFVANYAHTDAYAAGGGAIYNTGSIGNISGNFIENYVTSSVPIELSGGAIYNSGSSAVMGKLENVTFQGNYIKTATNSLVRGGAIANIDTKSNTIGNISGSFIGNYAETGNANAQGGAIANHWANLSTITNSEFKDNYVSTLNGQAHGGAIYNNNYTYMDSISNTLFEGNQAVSNTNARGGAIYNNNFNNNYANKAKSLIDGTFKANVAYGGNEALGGAICNDNNSYIGTVSGEFIQNTSIATGSSGWAEGGAIWNSNNSTIVNILDAAFTENRVQAENANAQGAAIYNGADSTIQNLIGTFTNNRIYNSKKAHGGAVFNAGTMGINYSEFRDNTAIGSEESQGGAIYNSGSMTLRNTSFYNNRAYVTNADNSVAGGAIYSKSDITVLADGGVSEFSGNMTVSGTSGYKRAIYIDNASATLTLEARNGGEIILRDHIDGASGYNVTITGDYTGTVNLYSYINDAHVFVNNVKVNFSDDSIKGNVFQSFSSLDNASYSFDVDLSNGVADTITAVNSSSGIVRIDSLNFIGESSSPVVVQILNVPYKASYARLSLNSINFTTQLDDTITNETVLTGKQVVLATTNTTYDSIRITGKVYDTLKELNQKTTTNERNFNFVNIATYTVREDLGTTSSGTLNINGMVDGNKKSTIDFNKNSGFQLNISGRNLNVSNVKFTNAVSDNERGSVINMQNTSTAEFTNVDFVNNHSINSGDALGSAVSVSNGSRITSLTGSFVGNVSSADGYYIEGGALWNSNSGYIDNIVADFVENSAIGNADVNGGAVYNNYSDIQRIEGDFIKNSAQGMHVKGGAIYNTNLARINYIEGLFKENSASGSAATYGGAIYNDNGYLPAITNSSFIGNYAHADSETAQGGAIYTAANIKIIADNGISEFTGNYSQIGDGEKNYNAIYVNNSDATLYLEPSNNGTIILNDNIDGAQGYTVAVAGNSTGTLALNNDIKNAKVYINTVNVSTANNSIRDYTFYMLSSNANAKYNIDIDLDNVGSADRFVTTGLSTGTVTLNSINFMNNIGYVDECIIQVIDNKNTSSTLKLALGNNIVSLPDAGNTISNETVIADVGGITLATTNTTDDSIKVTGKIYDNLSYINKKTSEEERNFNFVNTSTYTVKENLGTASTGVLNINGKTNGDAKSTIDMNEHSGFVVKGNTILNLTDVNIVNAKASTERGSVITVSDGNSQKVNIQNVTFSDNKIESDGDGFGAVISNQGYGIIGNINGKFENNSVNAKGYWAEGGAIWNSNVSSIQNIDADFIANSVVGASDTTAKGGAIYVNYYSSIENINANIIENNISGKTALGGAIFNGSASNIGTITGTVVGNYAIGTETARGGAIYNEGSSIDALKNIVFKDNYVKSETGTAQGGAIYTDSNLKVLADNGVSAFTGNYSQNGENIDNNAIYVGSSNATVTLEIKNKGVIVFDDNIKGQKGYSVNVTGDNSGAVLLNNTVENANVNISNAKVILNDETLLNNESSLALNNGTLTVLNNKIGTMELETLTLTGKNNHISLDIDPKNAASDSIVANNYNIAEDAVLYVDDINIMSVTTDKNMRIKFADEALAGNVVYNGHKTAITTPIFKYNVAYLVDKDNSGYFAFGRGSSGDWRSYNPAVLSSAVVAQAGAYTTMVQTFNHAFSHSDTYMNIPNSERLSYKNKGKYAVAGDTNMPGVFSPLMTNDKDAGFWVKPYATFENIPLKNGPKVQNINYGTLIGYDSPLESLKNGWDRVMTYYFGYNGSTQHFTGVDSYQNGGLAGVTMSLYKGKFFNATTVSAGATVGEISTMYGSETFTALMAGIANKTGYNLEFKEGRFIIQPSMFLSYAFVNTFDYTNAAGVRIDSDPLSVIQVAPGLKFIGNTKNGWQPYFAISMVWNITCDSTVRANNVQMPSMSIDPFVQYGLGLQKRVSDRFTGFIQAMIQNGGRNGVALTAGFRWAIGRGK